MFDGCLSLSSIPDISKWNIRNVKDISKMFSQCRSLISLPDLTKWKTKNIENISEIFKGCLSISFLPNIQKWKFSNFKNINNICEDCLSMVNLYDTSTTILKLERIFPFKRRRAFSFDFSAVEVEYSYDDILIEENKTI